VLEKRYIRKNGEILWARAAGSMRRDAAGRATQFIAIIEDITQQKRAEEALRYSEERLQLIFAQAPVAVCVLRGPELVFELVNPLYQQFFPGRVLMGKALRAALPEMSSEIVQILQRVRTTGEVFSAEEYKVPLDRDEDGVVEDYWFTFVYHPLREFDGTTGGVVAIAVDVTTHVKARQELERANRNLEEFAYVASHDLQEPLRMVKIYTQLLIRNLGKKTEDDLRGYAAHVETGASRMENLIRDLLDYSRTDHADEQELAAGRADLNRSLQLALTAVDTRVVESAAEVSVAGPLPVVVGNEGQFIHVFQNLLTNALKYHKAGEAPKVRIEACIEGGECIVSVRDQGIGFDQEHAERVFGLFKRLHNQSEYPGTGLGLAICRRIVERYRGRMWAESKEGAGAAFYFALPVASDES
jgi:PAS domain S-box-containing protein